MSEVEEILKEEEQLERVSKSPLKLFLEAELATQIEDMKGLTFLDFIKQC
jgi:uncharacterized protein (DUF2164 family)